MKKKNLVLKIAALLFTFGSIGALNVASNSTFAMESSYNSKKDMINEEKDGIAFSKEGLYYYLKDDVESRRDKAKLLEAIKRSDYSTVELFLPTTDIQRSIALCWIKEIKIREDKVKKMEEEL